MSRLLDLPLELREKILEYLVSNGTCTLTTEEQRDHFGWQRTKLVNIFTTRWAGLARTNKQLNMELEAVLKREKPHICGVRVLFVYGRACNVGDWTAQQHSRYRIVYIPGDDGETLVSRNWVLIVVSAKDEWADRRCYRWYCSIDRETHTLSTYGPCMIEEQFIRHYTNGGKLDPGVHTPDFIFKGLNVEIRASEK